MHAGSQHITRHAVGAQQMLAIAVSSVDSV